MCLTFLSQFLASEPFDLKTNGDRTPSIFEYAGGYAHDSDTGRADFGNCGMLKLL